MKRNLLFLLLAFFFFANPSYPEDKVFPTSDAIWNVHLYKNGYYKHEIFYGLVGDTIVNDMTYNKLYSLPDTILIENEYGYLGGIRQEGKQVWFLPGWVEWDEFLLYDFSKETGDWVEHGAVPYFLGPQIYDANYRTRIYNVEDSKWGKKLLISQYGERYWIEGIGDTEGFFSDIIPLPLDFNNYSYRLACLKQGDELVYLNNERCETCFCLVEDKDVNSINDVEEEMPVFILVNKLNKTIQVSADTYSNLDFILLNLQGQTIKEEKLSSTGGYVKYATINPGVYIYQITEKGKIIQTGKLILE